MNNIKRISSLFDVIYGNGLELYKLEIAGHDDTEAINFISRTSKNNGVAAKVKRIDNLEPFRGGVLTVAVGGSVLETFLQKQQFYTAYHVMILTPKQKMSEKELLFYAYVISLNKYRYNYGRQANKSLPHLLIPQYNRKEFEDISINELNRLDENSIMADKLELNHEDWLEFDITRLFHVKGSKGMSLLELEEYGKGKYPYITTQAENNGIKGFYDYSTEDGGVITFDSAVTGYCAYQPLIFSASDHVEKLIPKFKMSKYIALFLVTVLNQEQYRYNYGRKRSQARMKQISIKLPAENGKPNWEFMENYIKSLPYSGNL